MTDKITTSLVPYKFEYAMSRLKDAIDYAVQTGEFEGLRLWAMNVEESHNAEVVDMKAELKSADEGLKLFHSIASNGEQSVLSRLDGKVDEVDAQRWRDEREPYTDRKVTVPQTLRSYASYNNTGKGQPLSAADVDGERLGE